MTKIFPSMTLIQFVERTAPEVGYRVSGRIFQIICNSIYYVLSSRYSDIDSPTMITLESSLKVSPDELKKVPGFGSKAFNIWHDMLDMHNLFMGMSDYQISHYFADLNDTSVHFTDGDDFAGLSTDVCLRYLLSAGYIVSITPNPRSHA